MKRCGAWTYRHLDGADRLLRCTKPVDGHTDHQASGYRTPTVDGHQQVVDLHDLLPVPVRWVAPAPAAEQEG